MVDNNLTREFEQEQNDQEQDQEQKRTADLTLRTQTT